MKQLIPWEKSVKDWHAAEFSHDQAPATSQPISYQSEFQVFFFLITVGNTTSENLSVRLRSAYSIATRWGLLINLSPSCSLVSEASVAAGAALLGEAVQQQRWRWWKRETLAGRAVRRKLVRENTRVGERNLLLLLAMTECLEPMTLHKLV